MIFIKLLILNFYIKHDTDLNSINLPTSNYIQN